MSLKTRCAALLCSLLGLAAPAAMAQDAARTGRQAILDAARPRAAALAGQAVRIRVDRLNVDQGWAILVGSLVSANNKSLDWSKAEGCEPDLDRMLWVVLKKSADGWQVKHLEICAAEPPWWYLEQYGGMAWPCGVYAGLENSGDGTLEQQCRAQRQHKH